MLSVNDFFAKFPISEKEGSPTQSELQPIHDFLVNAGAKFAIDTENGEIDRVLIKGLLAEYKHYNWEVIFEYDVYSVAHVETLDVWIVDFWQDSSEKIINTWFVG